MDDDNGRGFVLDLWIYEKGGDGPGPALDRDPFLMVRRFVCALFGPILSWRVESVAACVLMGGWRVLRGRGNGGQRQRRNNDKRCSHSVPPFSLGAPPILACLLQSISRSRKLAGKIGSVPRDC